jgi:hypothetical protein
MEAESSGPAFAESMVRVYAGATSALKDRYGEQATLEGRRFVKARY